MKQRFIIEWTVSNGEYEFYFDNFERAMEFWNEELGETQRKNGQFYEKKYKFLDGEYVELSCKIIP